MKKMGKVTRLIVALLTFTLLFQLFPIESGNNLNKVQAATTLNNPRIVADSSMESGKKVTWDCVWFGAYPQSEVTGGDIYNTLKNAKGWDGNNDIVINGNKYRRLKGEDATYYNTNSSMFDYNWNNDYSSYHYFKYEPIKWRVLEVCNGQALLLADKVLDTQEYNKNYENVTWETSSIRSWLNGQGSMFNEPEMDYTKKNFINTAFLKTEQESISGTNVINNNNIEYGTSGGNNTFDKIFLLAESQAYTEQAKKYGFIAYGSPDEGRRSKCSTYAFAMGCSRSRDNDYKENVCWWLRSPGSHSYYAAYVYDTGWVFGDGNFVSNSFYGGVRPALYLNLSSSNLYSYAGTVCSDGTINEEPAPTRLYQDTTSSGNTGNNSSSNNTTGNNNSNNANNTTGNNSSNNANTTGNNNSNNTNNNKNNTTTNTKPSTKTTASKKPTKRALLPVEKMTGSLKSVKSPAKSTLAIIWKKLRKVTGYQVQFCAKSNFKKGTIERKFKQKVTKTKVRPLKSKKKYYVRMRPYTKSGSKMYYGKWSKVKSVKIK